MINYNLQVFGTSVFALHKSDGRMWFRIFHVGMAFKDYKKHGLLLGQSQHIRKYIKLGNLVITFLRRYPNINFGDTIVIPKYYTVDNESLLCLIVDSDGIEYECIYKDINKLKFITN